MKNKGITLIALVVTIIILLILAGVAITSLTNTDLFENAKQAKTAMENAENVENATLSSYENKINEIVGGTTRENSQTTTDEILWDGIADTVDQEYTLNKSVNEYKRLIIYSSLSLSSNINANISSLTIETSDISYPESENFDVSQFILGGTYNSQYIYSFRFYFSANNKFKIQSKIIQGWNQSETDSRIYKIIGIK